jgi:hypothetical protein
VTIITDKLKEKVKDVKDKLVETKDKVTDTTKEHCYFVAIASRTSNRC